MPIPRAKILTRIEVPTGGWTLRIIAEYGVNNINIDATIPAGSYFMAWDQQADDFLWVLANAINVAFDNASGSLTGWKGRDEGIYLWIDEDHKAHLGFEGDYFRNSPGREISIEWTLSDESTTIGDILGFDTGFDLVFTGVDYPTAAAEYHHAYGWYSDADGQTEMLFIEPHDMPNTEQTYGPGGHSKSQYIGSRFINRLDLVFISQVKMWSRDIGYTEESVYPYERNVPLQCWFKEARKGAEFRVYRHNTIDTGIANESGVITGGGVGNILDTGKSWGTDPDRFPGSLLYSANYPQYTTWPMRFFITSNSASQIHFNIAEPRRNGLGGSSAYWIFDQPYQTYVIDSRKMRGFAPRERGSGLNLFDLSIPLSRFET